ncbi:MAG: PIN domain-containing protein [Chloroflexi bacterium]|nr:PIN domain-containing protein [Chloroflexota bacterium]MBU1662341.1 PIN domain-containing protein [Chloroflexota bacterium]
MFTIDASVHISAFNPAEIDSAESQAFIKLIQWKGLAVFSPTLLLVEVAASVARVFNDTARGTELMYALQSLRGQTWVPLDESLAQEAGRMGAEYRLRGADAVYGAVAQRNGTTLVTLDQQQLERLKPALSVQRPGDALAAFSGGY